MNTYATNSFYLFVLAGLLISSAPGCSCDPESPPAPDAGPGDASVDAGGRDAGVFPDAGPGMDGGLFFERLYGGNDGIVPGNPCMPADDRCRSSSEMFICIDTMRDPMGAGATCEECMTDDECRFEYWYVAGIVTCNAMGRCELPGDRNCSPGVGWCQTARAGNFACIDGNCNQCISNMECQVDYGMGWECIFASGQCRDSTTPPDAGVDSGM